MFQKRTASHKPLIQLPSVQVLLVKVPHVQETHSEDNSISEVTEDDQQLTSLVKMEKEMGSYCMLREIRTFFEFRGIRWPEMIRWSR